MKYLNLTARDCQHIRHFLTDVNLMLTDYDLGFQDDGFMYEAACFDPMYKAYMEIFHALCKAGQKLNELEELINNEDKKELAS